MDDFNEGWVPATYLEPVYGESDHQVIHLEPGDGEKEKRGRAWGHYVGVMDERMMGGGGTLKTMKGRVMGWRRGQGLEGTCACVYILLVWTLHMFDCTCSYLPSRTSEEVHITTSKYTATNADELSFERGVLMDVYQKGLDGWWKARSAATGV